MTVVEPPSKGNIFSKTKRTAKVRVLNKSGANVLSVSVVHKYSEYYTANKTWTGPIADGAATADDLTVTYETGFFGGMGSDWFVASFQFCFSTFLQFL